MRKSNKKVVQAIENKILFNLCYEDFKRYQKEFPRELDFNIFQYGNLDIYNYDLFMFFKNIGVTEKFILNYEKQLESLEGVNDKTIDILIYSYKNVVRKAVLSLNKKISLGLVKKEDFAE